jgi:predicted secreted Zn-dependent protease
MPHVSFTRHLQTFFPALKMGEEVPGATVREVIAELEKRYPGFALYVGDETGRERLHRRRAHLRSRIAGRRGAARRRDFHPAGLVGRMKARGVRP